MRSVNKYVNLKNSRLPLLYKIHDEKCALYYCIDFEVAEVTIIHTLTVDKILLGINLYSFLNKKIIIYLTNANVFELLSEDRTHIRSLTPQANIMKAFVKCY